MSTLATTWTVACQAPLSMGLSRQEYWSVLPFPSPGDLSYPRIEPRCPALQADSIHRQVLCVGDTQINKIQSVGSTSIFLIQYVTQIYVLISSKCISDIA